MSAFGRPLVCERSYATLQHLSKLLNFYQTHSLPRLASLFFETKLKRGYEINGIAIYLQPAMYPCELETTQ